MQVVRQGEVTSVSTSLGKRGEKEVTIGYEEVLYQYTSYTNGDGVAIETCLYSQLNKQVNGLYRSGKRCDFSKS